MSIVFIMIQFGLERFGTCFHACIIPNWKSNLAGRHKKNKSNDSDII